MPTLHATAANYSLTLSAVGSCRHRRSRLSGGEDVVCAQENNYCPAAEERRRFQRVKVHLLGRYMLPDRREFPCQIINMSPGGLALLAPGIGNVGDRVIAYLDHIGRVEGKITRIIDNGFAMTRRRHRPQARQARGPADLARQPRHPQSAGRPPPRPYHSAQPDRAADARGRQQDDLPHHRPVAVGRRHRRGKPPAAEIAGACSARCSPGWCETSRKASRSSSSTSRSPRRSKTALPRGKAPAAQIPCFHEPRQAASASRMPPFAGLAPAKTRLTPRAFARRNPPHGAGARAR